MTKEEIEKENKTISRKANEAIADKLLITAKYNEVLNDLNQENDKLQKENAELQEQLKSYNGCGDWDNDFHTCRVYLQHEELQMYINQLTKAVELLKWALHSDPEHDNLADFDIKWKEAEQFIKEIEK